jgi:hypothetical protein
MSVMKLWECEGEFVRALNEVRSTTPISVKFCIRWSSVDSLTLRNIYHVKEGIGVHEYETLWSSQPV